MAIIVSFKSFDQKKRKWTISEISAWPTCLPIGLNLVSTKDSTQQRYAQSSSRSSSLNLRTRNLIWQSTSRGLRTSLLRSRIWQSNSTSPVTKLWSNVWSDRLWVRVCASRASASGMKPMITTRRGLTKTHHFSAPESSSASTTNEWMNVHRFAKKEGSQSGMTIVSVTPRRFLSYNHTNNKRRANKHFYYLFAHL